MGKGIEMTVSVCELGKEIKGKTILDGISLDAPGGCVTGLSGVNGSGKDHADAHDCGPCQADARERYGGWEDALAGLRVPAQSRSPH